MALIFVFLDGIGMGSPDPRKNPFMQVEARSFRALLGGSLHPFAGVRATRGGAAAVLDAGLGVPGLPQSATGQTALLTGRNAPRRVGRHVNAYPTPSLVAMLEEDNIFMRVHRAGGRAAFLNFFDDTYLHLLKEHQNRLAAERGRAPGAGEAVPPAPQLAPPGQTPRGAPRTPHQPAPQPRQTPRAPEPQPSPGPHGSGVRTPPSGASRRRPSRFRPSASTVASLAAGVALRRRSHLLAGEALYHDVTGHWFRERIWPEAPLHTPRCAAEAALRAAGTSDLLFFEHFLTDMVGHRRSSLEPAHLIDRLDAFLGHLVAGLRPGDYLLLTSDHGNLEDMSTRSHTTNPVPLALWGPCARDILQETLSPPPGGTPDLTAVAAVISRALALK